MSENRIPTTPSGLLTLGNQMVIGLNALGTTLGITEITPATFQPVLTAYTTSNTAFLAARSSHEVASLAAQAADAANAVWLLKVRGVLMGRYGARWNTNWAGAGFIHNSTAVPSTVALRLTLVNQLVDFFTANPTFAVAGIEVTAAKASSLSYTATTTRGSANAAKANLETKQALRTTAETALVTMMRDLIKIISMKLSRTDGRWTQFGLNIPATPSTPGQPQEVAATTQPGHTIVATCAPLALAQRYRWRIKVLGVDAGFRLGASSTAPLAEIKSVEAGQTVDLFVQGVNGGSQGVASATVRAVLPLAATTSPVVAPAEALALEPTPGAGENGHRNGNGAYVAR